MTSYDLGCSTTEEVVERYVEAAAKMCAVEEVVKTSLWSVSVEVWPWKRRLLNGGLLTMWFAESRRAWQRSRDGQEESHASS